MLGHAHRGPVLKVRARQSGMTLIELMVGVSLVAILVMMAVPSFSTSMQNRQVRSSAESIRSALQYARNEALRRNRSVSFTLQSDGGWVVGCDPADASLVAGEQVCAATIQSRPAVSSTRNAQVTAVQTLASDGSVAGTPVFTGNLRFTSLGRVDTATLPSGNVAVYDVTNPTGGTCAKDGGEMRCLRIAVTTAGQVRMCDQAVTAAGDPRAC